MPISNAKRPVVLVPTYNEAGNIEAMLEALMEKTKADVLVIDDSSPDGTGDLAEAIARTQPRVTVAHRPGKQASGWPIVSATNGP